MRLTINSEDRISSSASSSDFTIKLAQALTSARKVSLKECQLPNSIYKITSVNNVIAWNRSSTDYSYSVPVGNYTISSLLSTIQSGMEAANSNTWSVTSSNVTSKVTISGTGAFTLTWASVPTTGIFSILGWTASNTSSGTTTTAPNVYALYKPLSVYLYITQLGTGGFCSNGVGYTYKVTINDNSGGIISWASTQFLEQSVTPSQTTIGDLSVKLFSGTGSAVDLNGVDWSFTLESEC